MSLPQIAVGDYGQHVRHHSEKDYRMATVLSIILWKIYILQNTFLILHTVYLCLMQLTDKGEPYQIITATWQVRDDLGIQVGGYNVGILKDSVPRNLQ